MKTAARTIDARMKIRRQGDLIWVRELRHLDLDVIVGVVDSVTHPNNPFQPGDPICFAPCEVLDQREVTRPPIHLVMTT